jgi:hypothetical protein
MLIIVDESGFPGLFYNPTVRLRKRDNDEAS